MRQVISLFLPTWPTDQWRVRPAGATTALPPETPLALTGRSGSRRLIVAADHRAQALGVHPGMAATLAQALVPGLALHTADPAADATALVDLAVAMLRRYSPIVAVDPPDGIMLDVTGAAHRHGGLDALLDDIHARLRRAGVHARLACGPRYGAAHALARFGREPRTIITDNDVLAALAPLPVGALRLDAALAARLGKVGIDTVGDLAALPRAALALRFGSVPGVRLDQALGRRAEPFSLVAAPNLCRVEQRFTEPIGAPETLARYTAKLVGQLCAELERRGVGAQRVDLLFHRVDHEVQAIRTGLARPTRDPARLARLLIDRLETVAPGFGIERMQLAAPEVAPLTPRTVGDLGEAPRPDCELLDPCDR